MRLSFVLLIALVCSHAWLLSCASTDLVMTTAVMRRPHLILTLLYISIIISLPRIVLLVLIHGPGVASACSGRVTTVCLLIVLAA